MANYDVINGAITGAEAKETSSGKAYLNISFFTDDVHENDSGYHDIKMWFTSGSLEYDQKKIKLLREYAGLPEIDPPTTINGAIEQLMDEALVCLEIPINVSPNENPTTGKVYAQYDVGYKPKVASEAGAFAGFQDVLAQRLAKLKGQKNTSVDTDSVPVSVYDDEDVF
jgi:hypothetical protein